MSDKTDEEGMQMYYDAVQVNEIYKSTEDFLIWNSF